MNRLPVPLLLFLTLALAAPVSRATDRIIIKLRPAEGTRHHAEETARLTTTLLSDLSVRAGVSLTLARSGSGAMQVLRMPNAMSKAEARAIAARIAQNPQILYAEPDRRLSVKRVPDDPRYGVQWDLQASASEPGSANLPAAWDITTGDAAVVMAEVDTGVLPHADLAGRTFAVSGQSYPYGYDFISPDSTGIYLTANDGDGRDADPTDPGDWLTSAEIADNPDVFPPSVCTAGNSSWHGTHVAGTLGAASDNGTGVAGVNWTSMLVPVRVLGKCGGYISDIADAIRWSAGLAVPGAPANTHPAQVINLSLGGSGSCPTTLQNAITDAVDAGAVVVTAAGNDDTDASSDTPANCSGVITVAAVDRSGAKATYSDYGATVEIAAPGGDSPSNPDGILSLLDGGTTTADNDGIYAYYVGTSMATPHVTGVLALMLSANYSLTGKFLTPAALVSKLRASARAFPAGSSCTTALCGSGIVDAAAAVTAVSSPPTADAGSDGYVHAGQTATLDGSASSDDGTLSYQWAQTDASGYSATIAGATSATATAVIPPDTPAGTVLTFSLTVTDDVGLSSNDSADITVSLPLLQTIGDHYGVAGEPLAFDVSTIAANVTTPALSATGLPVGATFTDHGDGSGSIAWGNPVTGDYTVTVAVNDPLGGHDTETFTLHITPAVSASASTVSDSGGGGGGALNSTDIAFFLLLMAGNVFIRPGLISQNRKHDQ